MASIWVVEWKAESGRIWRPLNTIHATESTATTDLRNKIRIGWRRGGLRVREYTRKEGE